MHYHLLAWGHATYLTQFIFVHVNGLIFTKKTFDDIVCCNLYTLIYKDSGNYLKTILFKDGIFNFIMFPC